MAEESFTFESNHFKSQFSQKPQYSYFDSSVKIYALRHVYTSKESVRTILRINKIKFRNNVDNLLPVLLDPFWLPNAIMLKVIPIGLFEQIQTSKMDCLAKKRKKLIND